MEERLAPVRTKAMAFLLLALVASGPWLGWWTLAPLAVAAAGFKIVDASLDRFSRPEFALAGVWMLTQMMIAASISLTGGAHSPAMAWLAIPVVTLPARYDMRGVIAGVAYTAALMLLVTVGLDLAAIKAEPQFLIAPLAMLFGVAVLSTALMNSDLDHRQDSVLDTLTGMLNRRSLSSRVVELAEQAKVTAEPVGIIVADIDHFKHVNDAHGHQVGDAVLVDVAYSLRKDLRAFDLAYRLGGEEFLVLLPGASAKDCAAVAERLRHTIENHPCGGLSVTMSFGTASSGGECFDWDDLLASADAALYQAKRDGRNRVVCATSQPQLVDDRMTAVA
jgi:diguanylate cyclase (GGDEF)-like protein